MGPRRRGGSRAGAHGGHGRRLPRTRLPPCVRAHLVQQRRRQLGDSLLRQPLLQLRDRCLWVRPHPPKLLRQKGQQRLALAPRQEGQRHDAAAHDAARQGAGADDPAGENAAAGGAVGPQEQQHLGHNHSHHAGQREAQGGHCHEEG